MGGIGNIVEDVTGINVGSGSRADNAVRGQRDAAREANALQREMYNQTREDLSPYRQTGAASLSELAGNKFMDNWQQDPGYQFRMSEGMRALQNSAAARGNLNSGATLKALSRYGQDYASQEYGNIYNREFNRLSQLANWGQNSAAQTGTAGMNYAAQAGENTMGAANAAAAAAMGQNNQTTQLIGQGAQAGAMIAAFSDQRLKENIKAVSLEDLKELKQAIKPYHFNYISPEFGEGEWVGIMAQDIEHTKLGKIVVFEDEQGRKKVHLPKLLSLLVTTFKEEAA